MTEEMERLIASFVVRKELFFIGCESVDEQGLWDQETRGDMRLYFENALVSAILRIMASDERFSKSETGFLADTFEIRYTAEELMELYQSIDFEESAEQFVRKLAADAELLRGKAEGLEEAFRELVILVCRIIGQMDGITQEESALTDLIIGAFENGRELPEENT